MSITSKQRAALRSKAHHLDPMLRVGLGGVTDALVQALDDALRTHELVKIGLTKGAEGDVREIAHDLAARLGAEMVQVIGRTGTMYRENPEIGGYREVLKG
jgi:RNA-binding protein